MTVTIVNYAGECAIIEVPESAVTMVVEVITGDEVVTFLDADGVELEYYDSAKLIGDLRTMSFFDCKYEVPREDFEKWSSFSDDSYVKPCYREDEED